MDMNTAALAEVFPAGEHLADELEARGWTQTEFAEILDRPAQFVSEIISGKKEITRESAAQLGAALGTSAQMWLSLQDSYFLWKQSRDKAMQEELSDVRVRARLNDLAISALRNQGIITSTTTAGQVEEVKKLYNLPDVMDEPQLRIAARRGNDAEPLTPTQKAWLACVERDLPPKPLANYSQKALRELARDISSKVRAPAGFMHLPAAYAEVGVRLVYVAAFPGSRLSGVSFLLDGGPVIALSGLRRRLDIVLFTLLHETAHIARGDLDRANGPIIDDEDSAHTLGDEKETDELAASWILPSDLPAPPARVSQEWVTRTAASLAVHPIVIVGRLQRLKLLTWRTALAKDAPSVIPYLESWSKAGR
jgi:HTH-type transcriptional regulator/antitoxin HigA